MSIPRTDPFGLWLAKWIVTPLLVVGLTVWVVQFELMKRKCRRMAEEHGYLEGTYYSSYKGSEEQCICRKRRNPDGTVDVHAEIVIRMH